MKVAIAIAFIVAGCATETVSEPSPVEDGLTLRATRSDHIAGDYTDPTRGHVLRFATTGHADLLELHLATGAGVALIDADTVGDTYRFSYLGGRLTMTVDRAWNEAVRAEGEDGPAAQDESALRWDGDMAVLDEMLTIPEVQSLAW